VLPEEGVHLASAQGLEVARVANDGPPVGLVGEGHVLELLAEAAGGGVVDTQPPLLLHNLQGGNRGKTGMLYRPIRTAFDARNCGRRYGKSVSSEEWSSQLGLCISGLNVLVLGSLRQKVPGEHITRGRKRQKTRGARAAGGEASP
jgi:hypothetical protein